MNKKSSQESCLNSGEGMNSNVMPPIFQGRHYVEAVKK